MPALFFVLKNWDLVSERRNLVLVHLDLFKSTKSLFLSLRRDDSEITLREGDFKF